MASEKKINGYVTAARKVAALEAKYNAKYEKVMMPIKRRLDLARVKQKTKMQKMTGGELNAAAKILAQPVPVKDPAMAGFNNRHED